MESQSQIKARLLGESYGAAMGRLKKLLLFDLASKLNLLSCYRCKEEISTPEEFSVEHIVPWRGAVDPKAAFFDLEKIAFSHAICNSRAGNGVNPNKGKYLDIHGTASMYDVHGCRCEICRKAHSDKGKAWKRRVNYRNINATVV
jgi:hypothetical protein